MACTLGLTAAEVSAGCQNTCRRPEMSASYSSRLWRCPWRIADHGSPHQQSSQVSLLILTGDAQRPVRHAATRGPVGAGGDFNSALTHRPETGHGLDGGNSIPGRCFSASNRTLGHTQPQTQSLQGAASLGSKAGRVMKLTTHLRLVPVRLFT
jgi:hypothetical protein